MRYHQVVEGFFSKKLNRFLAEVNIDGNKEHVHIKNTGRLKEILQPGAKIALETGTNPNRKTKYSIIAAKKLDRWINIDSQVPNHIAYDALREGKIHEFADVTEIKREVSFGNSRFDIYYERGEIPGFIEVKGVTLEKDGIAMFPDAPTERGTKHVETLVKAAEAGYEASILFVVQMQGCQAFTPNCEMDPKFCRALRGAVEAGVKLIAYDCLVTPSTITWNEKVPIIL